MSNKAKKSLLAVACIACVLSAGCTRKELQSATVVKDCTGTYLRMGNVDYLVCNYETLDSYPDGSSVRTLFQEIGVCSEPPRFVCEMLHAHEGTVRVLYIQ